MPSEILVPAILAIALLVLFDLAAVAFGADQGDDPRAGFGR